ncbi:hypothetical protein [Nodularia spumigena]|uniref:hypothetical protein n=1 Tax=Nodularia spumigena TaxID=70799 RepID=UPI00232CA17D|nr:hypothetical protein [Nodularia spumigena]MDB9319394.1 hypothetical protein [Nodularia spumigena CS-590/01A]MDB9326141.1 hypothetical protein [Nodularia spumigena CS-590/02]MDB9337596.1 hypothetical protein [Nodularia spumigena CS-590/01]MDB9337973.1 hypothetical protein [Nodularia spumigena CS-589/07]MDB9497634.1 hypothetical protein [Nodularia spumigena CS-336/02]
MTNEFVARVTENLSNSHGTADVVQIGVGLLTVQILDLGFWILELVFFGLSKAAMPTLKSKILTAQRQQRSR